MRAFKFRAWDERKKIMHNDFQFIKSGDDKNDWIIFTSDKQVLQDTPHPFENPYFQQQLKIMQYVGVNDTNGKEIYEGDIVKYESTEGICTGVIYFVCELSAYYIMYEKDSSDLLHSVGNDTLNVISNIYENPELLK